MAGWLSRNTFTASDKLHADDLNNLHNDIVTWGGDVNGGGFTLSNVKLVGVTTEGATAVTSVFGRTGDVVAMAGDYTAAMVGAVPTTRQVIAGSGLTGGGPLSADITLSAQVTSVFGRIGAVTLTPADISGSTGVLNTRNINTGTGLTGGGNLSGDLTLAVVPDTTNQQVQVLLGGSAIATRHAINFISGANATVAVADNSTSNRVDVTVSSTGGSGGMSDPTTTLGDLIVRGPSITGRLAVGSNGLVLTADSTQPLGVRWGAVAGVSVTSVFNRTGAVVAQAGDYTAAMVTNAVDYTQTYTNPPWIVNLPWAKITNPPDFLINVLTTKGDLPVQATSTTQGRLPVGADGTVLLADSTQGLGVRWGNVTAVNTVFGRNGTVVAQSGDYSVAQVTGAVANTRAINTGTGLTGGGNLTADRTFSVLPDTTNQQVQVMSTGTVVGTRHAINFINGANVSLSISDDTTNNRVNVSIASTGGSGGMVDPTTSVGDLIVRAASGVQRLGVGTNGQVLTADSTQLLGVKWAAGGGGGSQSPWISDIDGGNYLLGNVKAIGVGTAAAAATARLDVVATGTEDGLRIVNATATARASLTLVNDGGSSLALASYGSTYATDPGLLGLEASAALVFTMQGSEAMRLNTGGHVLIGTPTDDGTNLLQVAGTIKSSSGGYVFPDGTTQVTAAVTAVASVFGRTGAVVAQTGDYTAAQVTGAVSTSGSYADPAWITSLAWSKITGAPNAVTSVFGRTGAVTATTGDYNAAQITNAVSTAGSYADPAWLTALNWSKITGAPAIVGQTPWLSNISGANHSLTNVSQISIGTAAAGSNLYVMGPQSAATGSSNSNAIAYFGDNGLFSALQIGMNSSYGSDGGMWIEAVDLANTGPAPLILQPDLNACVGIGVFGGGSFPLYTLDVKGDVNISSGHVYRINGTPLKQGLWTAGSGGAIYYNGGSVSIGTTENFGRLMVVGANPKTSTTATYVSAWLSSEPLGSNPMMLTVSLVGGASASVRHVDLQTGEYGLGNYPALTLQAGGGNVGIGTTSPVGTLHVFGVSNVPSLTANGASMVVDTNNGSQMILGSYTSSPYTSWLQVKDHNNNGNTYPLALNPLGGNVGIGTTSPLSPLTVFTCSGNAGSAAFFGQSADGTGVVIARAGVSNTRELWLGVNQATGYSEIQAAQATVGMTSLVLNRQGGNVGIGTTSPSNSLDIKTGYSIDGIRLTNVNRSSLWMNVSNGTNMNWLLQTNVSAVGDIQLLTSTAPGVDASVVRVCVTNAGNFGINTTSPSYPLHVIGDVNCTGVYRVNGSPISGGGVTTQNVVTASRAINTVYQNTSGKAIFVNVECSMNSGFTMVALTDSSGSPSQSVAYAVNYGSSQYTQTVSFWVIPGNYYKISGGAGNVFLGQWIEWS